MRSYADYAYYIESYKGTVVPEESFDRLALKASRHIDLFTFGKITEGNVGDYPTLPACACDMVEKIYAAEGEAGSQRELKSENTDGYSVSYVTELEDGGNAAEALRRKLYAVAKVYLANTGLLYMGVEAC